ncbi:hypothetical protein BDW67DRAFT_165098 [Aspergillus spinulosporus]
MSNGTLQLQRFNVFIMRISKILTSCTLAVVTASEFQPEEIITRDVCILGGGATGSYAAVQLVERGYSVAVVEQKDRLGGHSETLYLLNGDLIDYGIRTYFNDSVVRNFFDQLQVEYEQYIPAANRTDRVNFRTGERVRNEPYTEDPTPALLRYRAALEQFDYLSTGGFYLPDEVPEVLLRSFREFVDANDLHDALFVIWTFSEALGDILETPLLFVLQLFGTPHINGVLQGYIRPRNGSATTFRAAARYIGESNILYRSTAVQTIRNSTGVQLVAENADGVQKLIRARKLLIAFPPILPKLRGFDLEATELALFRKWIYTPYYAAIVKGSGIPDEINVVNTDPGQPGSFPVPPYECILDYSGVAGYYRTRLVGNESFTEEDAQQLVLDDLRRMGDAGTYPINEKPEIIAFESHWPTSIMVPVDDVRDGFYRELYALQGQRSTYYTGYAFYTDYSTQLWNYTRTIVDMMTAELGISTNSNGEM